jgi:hypothetical protein
MRGQIVMSRSWVFHNRMHILCVCVQSRVPCTLQGRLERRGGHFRRSAQLGRDRVGRGVGRAQQLRRRRRAGRTRRLRADRAGRRLRGGGVRVGGRCVGRGSTGPGRLGVGADSEAVAARSRKRGNAASCPNTTSLMDSSTRIRCLCGILVGS